MRARLVSMAVALGIVWSASAIAGSDTEVCIDAHVRAQRLRRDGKLRAAREALVTCARSSCPMPLVGECAAWLPEVERAVPSIVVEARSTEGRDLTDVRVTLDGELLAERLDGKAVDVDPGEHDFRFESAGHAPSQQRLVVIEGQRGRRVSATLVPTAPARSAASAPERPVPLLTYALGAIGVAGIGTAASLGGIALSKKGDLDDQGCAPNCSTSDVDDGRRLVIAGDVALAVGAAALVAATIVFFTRPTVTRREPLAMPAPARAPTIPLRLHWGAPRR